MLLFASLLPPDPLIPSFSSLFTGNKLSSLPPNAESDLNMLKQVKLLICVSYTYMVPHIKYNPKQYIPMNIKIAT